MGETIILPPVEYGILRVLSEKSPIQVEELGERLGEDANSIMRFIAELEHMGLIRTIRQTVRKFELTDEGRRYVEIGLPEARLIRILEACGGRVELGKIREVASGLGLTLSDEEVKYALANLGRANAVRASRGIIELKDERAAQAVYEKQKKLEAIARGCEEIDEGTLREFTRRGLVKIREKTVILVELTGRGRELLEKGLVKEGVVITALTPELIRTGKWREGVIKRFDLSIPPPGIPYVTKHFLVEFIDYVREVMASLGFEEAHGPHIELEFWNFDALFQAQDHPAREIHDTYFLRNPRMGRLFDGDIIERVAKTHENGWITGSRGWGYKWDVNKALRLILRTQTTAVSVRVLYERGDGEYRAFTIGRVFRPEVPDSKHSVEFHQLDGIIVGERVTFRHLLGVLSEIAKRLGLRKVMFKPAYFPFTSPSTEGYAYHERLGWVEFVGAGMFRPEVIMPLGLKRCRVAAFGIGLDRLVMLLLGIDDIRELFTNDLVLLKDYYGRLIRHVARK